MDSKDEQPFLKDKQALLNDIKKRHHLRPNKNTVIAARITSYMIDDYRSSKPYLTGKIEFEDGGEREACFFKFTESEELVARKIYGQTSKIADNPGILKPFFVTYYELKKIWLVCYEKFDSLLSDDPLSNIVLKEDRADSIRKLLTTIKYIHKRRLFHGSLGERCSYVVISGHIKIVFRSSLRTRDDLMKKGKNNCYEDPEEVENTKMKDLRDLRDMLKNGNVILQFGVDWEDQDSFFLFFDNSTYDWFGYDGFVDHLIDHPSLKKPEERNEYLFKIEQSIRTNSLRKASKFMGKLKDEEFTSRYSNWNDDDKLSQAPEMERLYNDENVEYDGSSVRDLIRFLRNAYVHYESCNKEEDFDRDVRTLYPDFLNRMHNYL